MFKAKLAAKCFDQGVAALWLLAVVETERQKSPDGSQRSWLTVRWIGKLDRGVFQSIFTLLLASLKGPTIWERQTQQIGCLAYEIGVRIASEI